MGKYNSIFFPNEMNHFITQIYKELEVSNLFRFFVTIFKNVHCIKINRLSNCYQLKLPTQCVHLKLK